MSNHIEVIKPPYDEPVFNSFKRKPLRPFYFFREFLAGMVILGALAATLAWVAWRGNHPDPQLFELSDELLVNKGDDIPIYERPEVRWVDPGAPLTASHGATANPFDPFPAGVISGNWRASRSVQMFDETNLYEKINGRETYYKAIGFIKLHCLSLVASDREELTIDIELFDQGNIANALGAFSGEISRPDQPVEMIDGSLWYATRNGGFLARGRYYARLIGSDDDESIREKIVALKQLLIAGLPGETLPWAYRLFVGGLQLSPGAIQYEREDAFSFGFANEFYRGKITVDGLELFVSRRASAAEAADLAAQLSTAFAGYANRLEPPAAADENMVFLKHQYLDTIEVVQPVGVYVAGARGAKTADEAIEWLGKLTQQLRSLD